MEPIELGPLAAQTIKDLRAAFDQYDHSPAVPMWLGLRSAVECFEGMANGSLAPIAYLSSLDPGVGKTEAIIHFVRALTASPTHRRVGVLICVSHLKEIASLADRMGLPRSNFAVYTTDDATNALGSDDEILRRFSFSRSRWFPRGCQAACDLATSAFFTSTENHVR